jgi:hypothetical protein
MIACHHVLQLHTCPYTVVSLLACCPNTRMLHVQLTFYCLPWHPLDVSFTYMLFLQADQLADTHAQVYTCH